MGGRPMVALFEPARTAVWAAMTSSTMLVVTVPILVILNELDWRLAARTIGSCLSRFLTASGEERMLQEDKGEKPLRYRILITEDEDGEYVAECPSLPGCISQGKTRELALENIQDAIKGYLESLKKHGDPIPPSISEEIVEVNV